MGNYIFLTGPALLTTDGVDPGLEGNCQIAIFVLGLYRQPFYGGEFKQINCSFLGGDAWSLLLTVWSPLYDKALKLNFHSQL